MTPQESLSSGKNMSDDNSGAKRKDNMLIIRMKEKPIVNSSYMRQNIPEKPTTALISSSD